MTRKPDPERLMSAVDAEKVHGIPSATVKSWYRRQRFTQLWHYGFDKRGAPMFRETDLLALRDRNRTRGRPRRS